MKRADRKTGSSGATLDRTRLLVLCALVAVVALGGFAAYRVSQVSKTVQTWKPGEVVVGSDRVARLISGLPTHEASDLSAADLSALWLAAFEAVQTGACAKVTGGGVQSPTTALTPGIYFISCGAEDAGPAQQKWYREDGHGIVACTDAAACAAR